MPLNKGIAQKNDLISLNTRLDLIMTLQNEMRTGFLQLFSALSVYVFPRLVDPHTCSVKFLPFSISKYNGAFDLWVVMYIDSLN